MLFAVTTLMSTTFLLAYSSILGGTYSVNGLCSLTVAFVGFYVYWAGESQLQDLDESTNSSEKKVSAHFPSEHECRSLFFSE